jgi:molybdate transport system substrate-binding protein
LALVQLSHLAKIGLAADSALAYDLAYMKLQWIFSAILLSAAIAAIGCKPRDRDNSTSTTSPAAPPTTAPAAPVIVLAAASAKDAMREVADAFTADTGVPVTISAGASNALANQILAGAPAGVFLSASVEWADKVREKGLADKVYPLLGNNLVMIVPKGNPAKVTSPEELLRAAVKKVALAGENVPAGKYARQALQAGGVYSKLLEQGKVVRGQDVRVTQSFVERGEAEAGVVYATDARNPNAVETAYVFDPASYDKIVYPLVLLKSTDGGGAKLFFEYLISEKSRKIFARYGFTPVG